MVKLSLCGSRHQLFLHSRIIRRVKTTSFVAGVMPRCRNRLPSMAINGLTHSLIEPTMGPDGMNYGADRDNMKFVE